MTLVRQESVETSPDESTDLDVEYSPERLVVCLPGRTISFELERDRQLAVLESDTHQVDPTPDDIPDSVLQHVLEAGWRLPVPARGERETDGEHVLWVGDNR